MLSYHIIIIKVCLHMYILVYVFKHLCVEHLLGFNTQ